MLQVPVNCAEGTYNVLVACSDLIKVVKDQLANGWQPTQDIPPVVAEAVRDLGKIAQNSQKIRDELAGDKTLVVNAIAVGGASLVNKVAF